MEIVIDFPGLNASPLAIMVWFFTTIGWLIPAFLFIVALALGWQSYIRNRYRVKRRYILLAIDVPKNNLQTPKAVENIFNQLAGAHQPIGFLDRWWIGEIPNSFTFEIVSIGGYLQFIIHLEQNYRDLIEAMIYAQYPDAEITEVEDYSKDWSLKFPNDKYQLWGTELILKKNQYYPIRVYREFEDPTAEVPYKDSMAALLEAMSRAGPGEQVWVQYIVTPADNNWSEGAEPLIKKLIGAKVETKKNILDKALNVLSYGVNTVVAQPAPETGGTTEPRSQMLFLTQGEKDTVSAIETKVGKIGFLVKIRFIYLAEKDKFKSKIPHTVYGAFKQFNTTDLNSLAPNKRILTASIFWFKTRRLNDRRTRILYRYRVRGHYYQPGSYGQYFNSEELATLFHFPVETVAPLLKTTETKKSQPPVRLPVEIIQPIRQKPASSRIAAETQAVDAAPPENLPISSP